MAFVRPARYYEQAIINYKAHIAKLSTNLQYAKDMCNRQAEAIKKRKGEDSQASSPRQSEPGASESTPRGPQKRPCYVIHKKDDRQSCHFNGREVERCPTCQYLPKQPQEAKGGWQNKMVAVVQAVEAGNKDLAISLCKTFLIFIWLLKKTKISFRIKH